MSESTGGPEHNPEHNVVDSGHGTPTGASTPGELSEEERAYADSPSRGGRDDAVVVGSEEGGSTSGGGGEAGTTPQVGNLRREGHQE